MSQTAFKISEGLNIKGLVLDNNSGTLTWNGSNLATESYVDTAIGNISIPPAYITSVDSNFTVTDGELLLNNTISVSEIDVAGSGDFTVTGSANIVLSPASGSKAYIGSVGTNNEIVTMGNVPAGYTNTDVDSHLSGGNGINYSSGTISINNGSGLTFDAGNAVTIDYSTVESQLVTDGFAKTSDIPSLSGYATETYVGTQIDNLVNGAPAALNTLKELADAINDDASYASTITTALGTKQHTLTASTGITIDGSYNISVDTAAIQAKLTAGNGISIVSDTVSLDPNVVINTVSLTDATSGVSASSDVFGNTTTSTYAMGSDVTVGTLVSTVKAADIFLQILDNSGNSRTSKLTAVFNGGSAPIWTEYGVVDSGTTMAATVSCDSSKHIIVNVTGSGTYAVRGVVTNLN